MIIRKHHSAATQLRPVAVTNVTYILLTGQVMWPSYDVTWPGSNSAHLLICCLLAGGWRQALFTCNRRVCQFDGGSLNLMTFCHHCCKQTPFCRTTKHPSNSYTVRTYGRWRADRWSRKPVCSLRHCAKCRMDCMRKFCGSTTQQLYRHSRLCQLTTADCCGYAKRQCIC